MIITRIELLVKIFFSGRVVCVSTFAGTENTLLW
jgi:hypothetical protein